MFKYVHGIPPHPLTRLVRTLLLALLLMPLSTALMAVGTAPTRGDAAAFPNDTTQPPRDKATPFGLEAAVGNRIREDEIDTAVALMREAGVQWQREEISWDIVQKSPGGPYNWTGNGQGFYNYDRAIQAQVAAGIHVLGLLDYNPAWFKSKNPPLDAWLNDWGDYVYNTVARYGRDRGWIKHWELWNEPNVSESGYESGLYEPAYFAQILQVGRAAAKAADPEATIVMGGVSTIMERPEPHNYSWDTYLELIGEAGAWNEVDILAIHFYQPEAPETPVQRYHRYANLRQELEHLDTLMERYGQKPVWITEMGWANSASWPGVSLDAQALYLIRSYLIALARPNVEKIFWYDFRDDIATIERYDNPDYNRHDVDYNLGLLRRTYPLDPNAPDLRKPAFFAYRTMTQHLGGLTLHETLAEGDEGFYWYRFVGNGRRVDVLWRTGEHILDLPIACDCQQVTAHNWKGEPISQPPPQNGILTVRLEGMGAPLFLEYQ